MAWQIGVAVLVAAIVVPLSATARLRRVPGPGAVLAAVLVLTVVLALCSAGVWLNTGDEYGYRYLADTLLKGRLWNPLSPQSDLFKFNWIYDFGGKRFSQYPPGWSAVLAVFVRLGVPQLANPVLTMGIGAALVGALRRLAVPGPAIAALATLILLSPFTLFNGASFFAHTASAWEVMAIVALQLRDEARPGWLNRLAIGALFSLLLNTRYEVFAITAALYGADRLWHRRLAFPRDALPMLAGALPGIACFLAYNDALTGHMLLTPINWVRPQNGLGLHAQGTEGRLPPYNALKHNFRWVAELLQYGGLVTVLAYAAALWTRLRTRRLRFFDAIPPGCVALFVFFPDFGGSQFGPRYWFFAWAPMALTIGAALVEPDSRLRLARWRPDLPTLAALQLVSFAGTTLVLAVFFRLYFDARRVVYADPPPVAPAIVTPAIVLFPSRDIVLGPWQILPYRETDSDLTRNGTDFDGAVLYGRGGYPRFLAQACALPGGRAIYIWQAPGRLERATCPP